LRKHLTILVALLLFFVHLHKENQPAKVNFLDRNPRLTIQQVIQNESILSFVNDSLLKPPYKTVELEIKWGPLHPAILGLTTEIIDGTYFIQLNQGLTLEQTQRVLMHELIHVYQFHYNLLEDLPTDAVRWKDEIYYWSMPWRERPWEIHAEAWSDKLYVPTRP
jgi:hypothetical protein